MVRLLLFTIAFVFGLSTHASECGIFKVVKGKVEFQKKNKSKYRKARVNKKVCSGDKIRTADSGRAKVVMSGGNELNISPNTELFIENYQHNIAKNEKKVLLNVLYGKIRSNVKQKYGDDEKSHFRVKTKSAVAGVRGTEFLTSFDRRTNQSRVVTFEGEVSVGNFENGKFVGRVTVKPGQFTSNKPGARPHPARQVPAKELAQMDRDSNIGQANDSGRGVSNDPSPDDNKEKEPERKEPNADNPDGEKGPGPDDTRPEGEPSDVAGGPEDGEPRGPASFNPDGDPELPDPTLPDIDGENMPITPPVVLLPPELPPIDQIQDQISDVIQNQKTNLTIDADFQ